jgi:hypothetical protein
MFYRESGIFVANQNFIEEDVKAVDEYLFKNQGNSVRVGRASDFTDVDEDQLESMLEKYDGSGQTGLVGDECKLCKGACDVSNDVQRAYFEKYPNRS